LGLRGLFKSEFIGAVELFAALRADCDQKWKKSLPECYKIEVERPQASLLKLVRSQWHTLHLEVTRTVSL
jgi:hypothetical protein